MDFMSAIPDPNICMGFFTAGERAEGVAVGDRLTDAGSGCMSPVRKV